MATEDEARRRTYERFGWLFSGGLLATRPATAVVARLSRLVTTALAFVAGSEKPGREGERDDD